ncbi:MAG: hypothetical protein LUC93_04010 [Planctomycetaceae bacterium]|nr:hypothetical protein [Planctomycetaceae bacterium]
MTAVMAFCGICLLLVLGKILRTLLPILQKLYLPASVIGGVLGLIIINTLGEGISSRWWAYWSSLPGFLINIVFATLFIGVNTKGSSKLWRVVAPQVCFGQIAAWGQYVVGFAVVLLILAPLFDVPAVFGNLMEIGFEGGHGTVGGMVATFNQLGFPEGADLGYTIATVGMIFGIIIGMIIINIGARRGYICNIRTFDQQSTLEKKGVYPEEEQPDAGKQTSFPDSIDSLALHISLVGIAVLIGFGLKIGLSMLDAFMPVAVQDTRVLQSFPLFPLCMIGGLLLHFLLKVTHADVIADEGQMQRISGAALDFLVVSAVATIRLDFVAAYWQSLAILCFFGIAWNVGIVLYIAPRMFREAWFERSIAEFGQSMGVTATGLMLLRTVDPESKTIATSAYGYKQLFHEPFMGGGIWTSLAVPLAMAYGAFWMLLICGAALLFWIVLWQWKFKIQPVMYEEGGSCGTGVNAPGPNPA